MNNIARKNDILLKRLSQQRLTQNLLQNPEEVVAWMGAVQAQDYPGAKWSLGMRMQWDSQSGRDESPIAPVSIVEQAFNSGAILRTHVMRPTWHFVIPADIRWLLELTAPRVRAATASTVRKLELGKALLVRSADIIAKLLHGNHWCTRREIGEALAEKEIFVDARRLNYIIMYAELEGIVCSGPLRGKQFTYALLDERAPDARRLRRDEALAELTRRYFTGHGPATIRDFSWWSGLTVAEVKTGLELAGANLDNVTIDAQTYYFDITSGETAAPGSAFLLPTFDEFYVGYAAFDRARTEGQENSQGPVFYSTIIYDGRNIGTWRRTISKTSVKIETAPFSPLSEEEEDAVIAAAQRYGDFLGMPAQLTMIGSRARIDEQDMV